MKLELDKEIDTASYLIKAGIDHYKSKGKPVLCGAGCSFCCKSMQVACLPEEVERIVSLGVVVDADRLQSQVDDWKNADKTCVFLKDDNCSIWNDRPLMCRRHMVTTPPENCDTSTKNETNTVHIIPLENRLTKLFETHGKVLLHVALNHHLKKDN